LPLAAETRAAHTLGVSALELALSGGEDYELLFAASEPVEGVGATRIGTFVRGSGPSVVGGQSAALALDRSHGFDHFSRKASPR
jgi:thiamine monophosphate kinase